MITYLKGDATEPVKKPALIMHICNDAGGWGRGFVLALSKKWPEPERAYRRMERRDLGTVRIIHPAADVVVANMIAQHGIYPYYGVPPIRYDALATCLRKVNDWCRREGYSIHAPRIGCGLAGGSWEVVEPLIAYYLGDRRVFIYDLPEASS